MLASVAIIAEILALVICIHCIYGKKPQSVIKSMITVLSMLIILEMANYFRISWISLLVYVILFFYCKSEFKCSVRKVVGSIILMIIVMASLQFTLGYIVEIFITNKEILKDAITNVGVLVICYIILPKSKVNIILKNANRQNKFLTPMIIFVVLVTLLVFVQKKIYFKVQVASFVLVVPAIIMLLFLVIKYLQEQMKADTLENEVMLVKSTKSTYDDLVKGVRLKQHELKNHFAAVFSTHYIYKTYESLVKAQREYCEKIQIENKYNNLLLLENSVLAAFIYQKFLDIEDDGINITYKISSPICKLDIEDFYLVEMLGILLDNAVEAVKDKCEKSIYFECEDTELYYRFLLRNPYRVVSYNEICEWFSLGKSEKGKGRGLGLYHLKKQCEELGCNIGCRNIEIEGINWIQFELDIQKAESE